MATTVTDTDKQSFRQGLGSGRDADAIWTILLTESATAPSEASKHAVRIACGNPAIGDDINDTIENGTALTDRAKEAIRRMVPNKASANRIITDLDNLS